jgi:hypothetical protein
VKRFAVVEDREFEIAGELFRWIYPYWEDIAKVFDQDTAEDEPTNGAAPKDPTVRDTIADYIDRIQLFIDPDFNDGIARWKALAKRKKNPIPHAQFAELYRWLLEVSSAPNPTEPSLPSEDGQLQTVTT